MINLKLSKKDQKKLEKMHTVGPDRDNYPWGTCLNFEKVTIDKSKELQALKGGQTIEIKAVAFVEEVRFKDTVKGKEIENIRIQVQKMDIGDTSEEELAFYEGD